MGKTFVKVELWNFKDHVKVKSGVLKPLEVKAQTDNGATLMIITPEIQSKLHLERLGKTPVRYANEEIQEKDLVTGLAVKIMNRIAVCNAIVEPRRHMALIGQVILEQLDLLIDSKNGKLIPNPQSPDLPLLDVL